MKIKGSFVARDQNKIISSGENLIVNNGKKIFFDWFTHQSYVNHGNDYVYQGKSLSSQRFLTSDQFTISGNSSNGIQQFWDTVSKATIYNGNTIYLQIVGSYINLSGLMLYLPYNKNTTNYQCCDYLFRYKIYTSYYQYGYANQNNLWTLQKIGINTTKSTDPKSNQKVIRFQSSNSVDGYIQEVKSIKIVFNSFVQDKNINLIGIGILSKTPYYNVPCVIGLGASNKSPLQTDTNLSDPICKLFVNSQKCSAQYYQQNNSETVCRTFDLNNFSQEQLQNIKSINIIYRTRMGYSQYNGIDFAQIGLFYSGGTVVFSQGADSCRRMFSHGIFDSVWSKDSDQIVDIQYTLSFQV